MNYKAFENLELIPQLLEKISILEIKLQHLEENLIIPLDLTNRKNVKTFLNISESTLNNMMKDGRLKRGVHYTKTIKSNRTKIVFIESAIKELKK
ncbi:hypothetical protein KKG81_03405 [bacterium]|jgi:hypothetical protein|nr:hypothetical protein [bacterium]